VSRDYVPIRQGVTADERTLREIDRNRAQTPPFKPPRPFGAGSTGRRDEPWNSAKARSRGR
jgi:hypothetical protein